MYHVGYASTIILDALLWSKIFTVFPSLSALYVCVCEEKIISKRVAALSCLFSLY